MKILEEKEVGKYLKKHPYLLKPYKKAKQFLQEENF